jgi:type VI secretion system protein ImpA
MDLSALLKSHGDEPSGENLEYDPAFISLELAAQPGEERQVGDAVIAAAEPDHAEVIAQAMDVLGRSHDLRAAVFLATSALRTRGLPAFAEVTGYIRGVLEQFWDTCHPQLDADDDDDPTMRVNAVAALAGNDTVLRALRITPLTDSRTFGRLTIRDVMIEAGDIAAPEDAENLPDAATIAAAFADTAPEKLETALAALERAHADVKAIAAVFDDRIGTQGPDLEPLERLLRRMVMRLREAGAGGAGAEDAGDAGAGAGAGEAEAGGPAGDDAGPVRAARPAAAGGAGAINGPQDVTAAIDRIVAYYNRFEPSSPVPLLLARVKRLVGASFLDIIKDMAPDGQDNVKVVAGLRDEEEDD